MLFGSEMLEVAIGLSFMYLLLSIVCSTVTEWISWVLKLRAKVLVDGIRKLVTGTASPVEGDPAAVFVTELLDHPLINSIKNKNGSPPSYINARTFAGALIATVAAGNSTLSGLRAALEPPPAGVTPAIPEHLRKQLAAILADAGNDVGAFRTGVETWFDDAMERVSGWYKRNAQRWTIAVAIAITLILNANTFVIASGMLNDPTARAVFVAQAQQTVATPAAAAASPAASAPTGLPQTVQLSDVEKDLQPTAFGLGWGGVDLRHVDSGALVSTLFGWFITVLALSMGAPFWFDLIGRLVNVRAAGKPPARAEAPAPADGRSK